MLVVSDGPLALCAAAAICGEVIVLASSVAAARVLQTMAGLRAGANVTVVCHEGDIVRAARAVLGDRVALTIVAEPYCHKYATWDEGMDGIAWGMDEVAVIRKHVLALCEAGVADAPTVLPHLKLVGRAFQCEVRTHTVPRILLLTDSGPTRSSGDGDYLSETCLALI